MLTRRAAQRLRAPRRPKPAGVGSRTRRVGPPSGPGDAAAAAGSTGVTPRATQARSAERGLGVRARHVSAARGAHLPDAALAPCPMSAAAGAARGGLEPRAASGGEAEASSSDTAAVPAHAPPAPPPPRPLAFVRPVPGTATRLEGAPESQRCVCRPAARAELHFRCNSVGRQRPSLRAAPAASSPAPDARLARPAAAWTSCSGAQPACFSG